ncbi:glycosyltransferase [Erythrobacter sp. SCSIO 43205]|uniref:glycosyltransferase n=1 Tax=Erythrobacter sp. SCSIO 43205 TaxID=2779361 RepID=UPI001CA9E3CE|nr:glycosyltransferase [Erythrobacter sp. SCSIO 43205]UAB78974.1 glycosyltransferase [Erythrobacter sp. SCSIO 43205]
MKIAHTVANIDEEASGPYYSVPSLVAALNRRGHDAEVVTVSSKELTFALGAPVQSFEADEVFPSVLKRLGRSRQMDRYIKASDADIFHAHGLWMMSNIYPARKVAGSETPLVLAPRGMLGRDALKFSKPVKNLFGLLYQNRALQAVSCFHATAQSELEDIRAFGLKQPVAIVPNGIDLPTLDNRPAKPDGQLPYILSLGRVHPKKALDRLISAFASVADEFAHWRLRIIGPSEGGYAQRLEAQAKELGLSDRVSIEKPVFGAAKIALMQQAEIFALSTLHENFAMTVAESLAVETPVISTKGAPWSGLESHGCGWWTDHGIEPMASALRKAMALSNDQRQAMGAKGREWMNREFGWAGIAAKMEQVYQWLLKDGQKPDFVHLG